MKVMPLGVKCVAYASGNGDGSLQVIGTALAEAQNFNEGVIEVWILFSGCEGAPAFGTAAIILRKLTSVPRPWPDCHMLHDALRMRNINAGSGHCMFMR